MYFVGILPSNFYRTILARDIAGFRWVLMKSLLLIGAVTLSIAAYKFLEGWVALGWRSALCNFLHERYLNRTMYYKLNVLDRKVDNPCGSLISDVSSRGAVIRESPLTWTASRKPSAR